MASPTRAEVETQWSNAAHMLEEARELAQADATNWVGMEDTLAQSVESDFAGEILGSAAQSRTFLAGLLSNSNAAQHLLPHLRSYLRHVVNAPIGQVQDMIDKMYKYMHDNSYTVNSRDFTFGSPAAGGGNAGNGVLYRLTKDEFNYDLEAQHADAKTLECKFDQSTGTFKHEELFEIRGQSSAPDGLALAGSNKRGFIAALSARNSLLSNPSFSQFGGTAASPTSITGWTSSVTVNSTNYAFDNTNYYRDFQGDTTPYSLQMKVTANLTQKLSVLSTRLNTRVPYMLQVAWNRQVGSASGTLVIRMGAANNSVAVSAQTGWQLLRVPASPGQNNWHRQFDEQDLDVAIEWTRTSGDLLIDDVLLVPATAFDGAWYWMIGGSTPFLREDTFTFSDSETGAVLQRWFWRAFGRYLPHATGAGETWADP